MSEIKRIDIKEFRKFGYLQELNRRFLHPLGLALEVIVEADGTERLGGVWDYRDDPDGIHYADTSLDEKFRRVEDEIERRRPERERRLGWFVQPPLNGARAQEHEAIDHKRCSEHGCKMERHPIHHVCDHHAARDRLSQGPKRW